MTPTIARGTLANAGVARVCMYRRIAFIFGLLFCIGVILLITLPWQDLRDHVHPTRIRWIPFISPPIRRRDIIGNILLYLPLGYFGRRVWGASRAAWPIALGAAFLSAATETAQLYSHFRFPSTTDLICNVLGAACGIWLARRSVHQRGDRLAGLVGARKVAVDGERAL